MNHFRLSAFSLVELLVAIFLGSLLMEAIVGNYLTAKRVSTMQHHITTLNDNMRVASFLLWQNIMQAGSSFDGEIHPKGLSPLRRFGICGYAGGSHMPVYLKKHKIIPRTDAIEIVKSSYHDPKKLDKITFFVGRTGRLDRYSKKPMTALYMAYDEGDKIEIVPDIMDMKIRYGIRGQQTTKTLVNAEQITDDHWGEVEVVMIKLKMKMKGIAVPLKHKIYVKLRAREQLAS